MRFSLITRLLCCTIFLVSCTQKPASIILKGKFFGFDEEGEVPILEQGNYAKKPSSRDKAAKYYNQANKANMLEDHKFAQKTYIVKKGDTLYRIALNNNSSVALIKKKNKLRTSQLTVGQKLIIPSKAPEYMISTKPAMDSTNYKKESKKAQSDKVTFRWPVQNAKILSAFQDRKSGKSNDGINITSKTNSNIYASADGQVIYSDNELESYGNLIIIRHKNEFISSYAHLDSLFVRKDELVKKGDIIGKIGQTGNVSQDQLYFTLRKNMKVVDPRKYLQ